MRTFLIAAVAAVSIANIAAQTTAKPAPVNITGKWTMTLETEAFTATPALEFKQDGAKFTGTYTGRYGTYPFQGALKERALEFSFKMSAEGTDVEMWFGGEVAADGQTMKGRGSLTGLGDATWSAKKEKSDK